MRPSFCLVSLLHFTLQWLLVSGGVTDRIIDDTFGDSATQLQVGYTGPWNLGQNCTVCKVNPDTAQAYDGTWHDIVSNKPKPTSPHFATLKFNGTAIWVYCILANTAGHGVVIFTNVSFELDGAMAGTYEHIPNPSHAPFLYNIPAFEMTDLSIAEHTLVMTAVQGSSPSVLLFDYAVYTYDDGEPSSSSTKSTPSTQTSTSGTSTSSSGATTQNLMHSHGVPASAIVGGVVGGVASLALVGICLALFLRRRSRASRTVSLDGASKGGDATPFVTPRLSTATFTSNHPRHRTSPSAADRDALERETEALRKQVATLRAEQSSHLKETRCESAISAPTRTVPSSATRSGVTSAGSEFYAGLNGELAALREAIASLTAEARDIEARSNPPPAYN